MSPPSTNHMVIMLILWFRSHISLSSSLYHGQRLAHSSKPMNHQNLRNLLNLNNPIHSNNNGHNELVSSLFFSFYFFLLISYFIIIGTTITLTTTMMTATTTFSITALGLGLKSQTCLELLTVCYFFIQFFFVPTDSLLKIRLMTTSHLLIWHHLTSTRSTTPKRWCPCVK